MGKMVGWTAAGASTSADMVASISVNSAGSVTTFVTVDSLLTMLDVPSVKKVVK